MKTLRYILISLIVLVVALRVVNLWGTVGYASSSFVVYSNASTIWIIWDTEATTDAHNASPGWSIGELGRHSDGLALPSFENGRLGIPFWFILVVSIGPSFLLWDRARSASRHRTGTCRWCESNRASLGSSFCPARQQRAEREDAWETAIQEQLVPQGWAPDRDVWDRLSKPEGLEPSDEARRILSRFGEMECWSRAKDVHVVLRPDEAAECVEQIRTLSSQLGHVLYPIGSFTVQDATSLLVDDRGHIYELETWTAGPDGTPDVEYDLRPMADSFEAAMRGLLASTS